jgi:hypothetical protein
MPIGSAVLFPHLSKLHYLRATVGLGAVWDQITVGTANRVQRANGLTLHDGGFPNRCSKFQGELELILQGLFPLPSGNNHVFAVTVHQCTQCTKSAQSKIENCAKLLKRLIAEVPEWFNGSVC